LVKTGKLKLSSELYPARVKHNASCTTPSQTQFFTLGKVQIYGTGPISQHGRFTERHSTEHLTCREGPSQFCEIML